MRAGSPASGIGTSSNSIMRKPGGGPSAAAKPAQPAARVEHVHAVRIALDVGPVGFGRVLQQRAPPQQRLAPRADRRPDALRVRAVRIERARIRRRSAVRPARPRRRKPPPARYRWIGRGGGRRRTTGAPIAVCGAESRPCGAPAAARRRARNQHHDLLELRDLPRRLHAVGRLVGAQADAREHRVDVEARLAHHLGDGGRVGAVRPRPVLPRSCRARTRTPPACRARIRSRRGRARAARPGSGTAAAASHRARRSSPSPARRRADATDRTAARRRSECRCRDRAAHRPGSGSCRLRTGSRSRSSRRTRSYPAPPPSTLSRKSRKTRRKSVWLTSAPSTISKPMLVSASATSPPSASEVCERPLGIGRVADHQRDALLRGLPGRTATNSNAASAARLKQSLRNIEVFSFETIWRNRDAEL